MKTQEINETQYWKALGAIQWRLNMGVMTGYLEDNPAIRAVLGTALSGEFTVVAPPLAGDVTTQIAWETEGDILRFWVISLR